MANNATFLPEVASSELDMIRSSMPVGPQRLRLSEPMQLDLDGLPWSASSKVGSGLGLRASDLGMRASGFVFFLFFVSSFLGFGFRI